MLYDTEFTAWEGSVARHWQGEGEHRELLQVAALKVELHSKGLDVIEQFNTLIKPRINPTLSDYIIELTGITQSHIDCYAVDLSSALHSFSQFAESPTLPLVAWGRDNEVIAENCRLQHLDTNLLSGPQLNLYQYLRQKGVVPEGVSSGQLAEFVGVKIEGHPHNALFDVDNIAIAIDSWMCKSQLTLADLQNSW